MSKESTCNADVGSTPGSERSPGGRHGDPLQYSCLEHPWTEEPDGGQKEWTRLKQLSAHTHTETWVNFLANPIPSWSVFFSVSTLSLHDLLPCSEQWCVCAWTVVSALEPMVGQRPHVESSGGGRLLHEHTTLRCSLDPGGVQSTDSSSCCRGPGLGGGLPLDCSHHRGWPRG